MDNDSGIDGQLPAPPFNPTKSIVCPACGKPINASAVSCEHCGTSLATMSSEGVWPPRPNVDDFQQAAEASASAKRRLYNIAVGQRNVLWAVLAAIGALLVFGGLQGMPALKFVGIIIFYGSAIYQIVAIYRLAKAFENLSPVLYVIACFIPCISLLALLHLIGKATQELTKNGVKVGLLGADPNKILP